MLGRKFQASSNAEGMPFYYFELYQMNYLCLLPAKYGLKEIHLRGWRETLFSEQQKEGDEGDNSDRERSYGDED